MILGIDLSGPRNSAETALAWFEEDGEGLALAGHRLGATNLEIAELAADLAGSSDLAVGIDAPLSYGVNSGSRAADKELRSRLIELGGKPGSVMAPTAPRMVYLTLRGIALARMLTALEAKHTLRVVEVHPGAAFLLRGAPVDAVYGLKSDARAREALLRWLEGQSMSGLTASLAESDHMVAACAAALATWEWRRGTSPWLSEAAPLAHPFAFAG